MTIIAIPWSYTPAHTWACRDFCNRFARATSPSPTLWAPACCRLPAFCRSCPALCRYLLGEELKLPSVPTWWCGQPAELNFVLEHLHEMVIKSAYPTQGADPVFGQELAREQLAELAASIKARPERYVAQNPVMYPAPRRP